MAERKILDLYGRSFAAPGPGAPAGGGAASGAPPPVVDVDARTFEAEVLRRSVETPVLVDFWAEWCGPCKTLSPILERLARERPGRFVLAKVDIDANPEIAQAFGIQSVPTVVAVARGRPVDAFTGALPEKEVRKFLDRVAPASSSGAAAPGGAPAAVPETGEEVLASGRLDEARTLFARALEHDRGDVAAMLGLARAAALAGRGKEAEGYLRGLPPAHAEAPPAEAVRAVLAVAAEPTPAGRSLAARDHRAACEALLDEVRRAKGDARTAARDRLVALFRVLGDRAPLTEEFRDRLARTLF